VKRYNIGELADWELPGGYGYVRVSGCDIDQVADLLYLRGWHRDATTILQRGWYRCSPCVCGEHGYDLNPAEEGERGAFFAYIVGSSWA
jgi:hypothetical protein